MKAFPYLLALALLARYTSTLLYTGTMTFVRHIDSPEHFSWGSSGTPKRYPARLSQPSNQPYLSRRVPACTSGAVS